MHALQQHLVDKNYIREDKDNARLTVAGMLKLEDMRRQANPSKTAFVAMWLDESIKEIYENAIKPAIKIAGYEALRIDKKEHINKIDDEIIASIRRSKFLIADFTHGEEGARGGVYYEAGFAHGLDIPVIFTCREDYMDKIHFDTRQYNTIIWGENKLDEFKNDLTYRILATLGEGQPATEKQ